MIPLVRTAARRCLRIQSAHLLRFPSISSPVPIVGRTFAIVAVKVPKFAESISKGTVAVIKKPVGAHVQIDEALVELETEKTTVAVNAPESGAIASLAVKIGDEVEVGQHVATIDTAAGAPSPPPPRTSTSSQAPTAAVSSQAPAANAAPRAVSAPTAMAVSADGGDRQPLIRFRHGLARVTSSAHEKPATASGAAFGTEFAVGATVADTPPRYARRTLTTEEIRLIEMGGADWYEEPTAAGKKQKM